MYKQKIRVIFFYVSIFLFFAGLPFLLSYALGYKFSPCTFRFTKTGMLILKTKPEGAEVYFDGNLLRDKTPTTINELFPGVYSLELKLKDHYSWNAKVTINQGEVTSYDKIILFPLRPDIKQLNKQRLTWFYVDADKGMVYYFDNEAGLIYRSDLDGNDYEKVGGIFPIYPPPFHYKFSHDKKKVLYFNQHQIGIGFLQSSKDALVFEKPFILNMPKVNIRDVFWHLNNSYIILVTAKTIEILELRPDSNSIVLAYLNKEYPDVFYDVYTNALYFQDSEKATDSQIYDNVYKIELKHKLFDLNLEGLKKHKADE